MLKNWRVATLLSVVAMLSILTAACGGSDNGSTSTSTSTPAATKQASSYTFKCVSGDLKIDGSTALQPLVTAAAAKYKAKCSGANITVSGGGSKTGLADAESGAVTVGDSDIFADPSSQSDLVDNQVSVVIFTAVINSKVTGVSDLTSQQLKDIYTGKITNWKELKGQDLPITVVSRPASSGTRATFRKYVLGGTAESPAKQNALSQDSTKLVLQTVGQTEGAIGYAALHDAKQATGVQIVTIDGKQAAASQVTDNSYKFWNIEHMYTKGAASGLAQAFISFVKYDTDGQAAAKSLDFVSITDMSKTALDAHPAPTK